MHATWAWFRDLDRGLWSPGWLAHRAEAIFRVALSLIFIVGAIGFTQDHALHFATRRLWAWRAEFGSDAEWAAALGRAAMAEGAAGFWPALTAKSFDTLSTIPPSSSSP